MEPFFTHSQSISSLKSDQNSLLSALDVVLQRCRLDLDSLTNYQTHAIKELLEYAYQHIPFYRKKYNAAGFHPSQFRDTSDIQKVPLLTKQELRSANVRELCNPQHNDKYLELATSGSSGSPIRVLRSENAMWQFSAYNMTLYHEWCQGKPLSNVLYLLDPTPHTIDYALGEQLRATVGEDRIQSAFLPLSHQVERILEIQPEFISSYPTTMRNIAGWLNRCNKKVESLKLLHLTSESMDPLTKQLLDKVLPNARIVQSYTSTEAGLVGYSCLTDGGFHVAETQVYAEIINEKGEPTHNTGRIVVTDLINRATPIIRYSGLEDYCRWAEKPCGCQTMNLSIAEMEGRLIDSIALSNGSFQSPYALTNAMGGIEGIIAYQIIQDKVSEFRVRVVMDSTRQIEISNLIEQIRTALSSALNEKISCEVIFESEILSPTGAHKLPLIISQVMRQQ
jgi:phenylacetate-CoA ligase